MLTYFIAKASDVTIMFHLDISSFFLSACRLSVFLLINAPELVAVTEMALF